MKRPGWGTAIGVLMIVFAGCTVKDSFESINMPMVLDNSRDIVKESLQKEGIDKDSVAVILEKLDSLGGASMAQDSSSNDKPVMFSEKGIENFVLNNLGDVFNMSEFTKVWMVRFGYIGLFIALLYAAGGVSLLIVKPYSVRIAYAALVISIIFEVVRAGVIGIEAGDLISIATYTKAGVSVVIDIILGLIIFSSDKFVYESARS